jgi:hypothetical protein
VSGFRPEIPQNFRRTQVFSFRIEKAAGFFDALSAGIRWDSGARDEGRAAAFGRFYSAAMRL